QPGGAMLPSRRQSPGEPAAGGGADDEGLVLRNRALRALGRPAARMAGAGRRLRPGRWRQGLSRHGRARQGRRGAWLRPAQPGRATYSLGVSAEAAEFAARHRLGLGVSYGNVELMAKATGHYRRSCTEYGWEPGPDDMIWRANMILAESDEAADAALERRQA